MCFICGNHVEIESGIEWVMMPSPNPREPVWVLHDEVCDPIKREKGYEKLMEDLNV